MYNIAYLIVFVRACLGATNALLMVDINTQVDLLALLSIKKRFCNVMVQLRHLPGGADCSMLTRQAQHKQSKIKFLRKYQISINIKRLSYHKSTQI